MNMMTRPPVGARSKRELAEIRHVRRQLDAAIERMIELVDELDGDPESEPSLGSLERHPAPYRTLNDMMSGQQGWGLSGSSDREDDAGDEAESDDLITLGWAQPDVRRVRMTRRAA